MCFIVSKLFDFQTGGEKTPTLDFLYNCHPTQMPSVRSHEHLLRFVDHKMTQEHVSRRSTEKYGNMQNTYHYLATFAPKMRSITGTVSFTDSTVYSESIGW